MNYYTTGTPAEGVTGVHSYQKVIYKNIYPNIDLEFLADDQKGFKYNFMIHPGGDLFAIRMKISCTDIILASSGSLILRNTIGTIKEEFPESYFIIDQTNLNTSVRFIKRDMNVYGFQIDEEIHQNATLIIDPKPRLLWSTYYGGSQIDDAYTCSYDDSLNIYLSGQTGSANNIATTGSFQSVYAGGFDAFLVKFNSEGERLWGTYFGGSGWEDWNWSAIDHYGNIYMTGATNSSSNIATPGSYQSSRAGASDAYLVKFNTNGFRNWGTYYGGIGYTEGIFISVDDSCNIYFGGDTDVPTGIASPDGYQTACAGIYDGFLAKFDSNGQRLWATYYGGTNYDQADHCAISNNIVYLSGETQSTNGISTPGSFQTSYGGIMDTWLAKFTTGGQLQWGTYYGGSLAERDGECAADTNGNIFLLGYTLSVNNIATPGSFQPALAGNKDCFLVKFNPSGQRIWGTYYGGTGADLSTNCAVDDSCHVFFCGQTDSPTNIASPNGFDTTYGGSSSDAFLVKFSNDGDRIWGTYYGDTGLDIGQYCAIDPCEHIYLTGYTDSQNNIATSGSFQTTLAGETDAFLVKFADCTGADSAKQITGPIDVCQTTNEVVYSVPVIAYSTGYIWNVPQGFIITSGINSNTITVNIANNAVSGNISVFGTNCCQDGVTSSLFITVHPRPSPPLLGSDSTCTGMSYVYSTASGKSQYQWNVSAGGSITPNIFTAIVIWNVSGAQWVSVNYTDTNGCTASSPTIFNVNVSSGDSVNVIISASTNNICSGTLVTFTAAPTNPGANPVYEWKVNGITAGSNNPLFTYLPSNNDQVMCVLTSSQTICISNNPTTSNTISMVVNLNLPVSISVSPSANPSCEGLPVTFTGAAVNGGSTPVYQWKVNGLSVGTNSPVFSYTPVNGDAVVCVLTSDALCATGSPAASNPVIMTVDPLLPAGVTITASVNPVCGRIPVTFTASPVNGGTNPSYQWKVNGIDAGTNSPIFTYLPMTNDQITCILTSNLACVTQNPASSNTIQMTTLPAPVVTFQACFDTITTVNAKPIKLKGGIPLGGTYSGPGVNSSTGIFSPSTAGIGVKMITYQYTNIALCSASRAHGIEVFPSSLMACGSSLVDIRDNQSYPTVQIGSQCWMAANLNYGTEIPYTTPQRDNCIPEKYSLPSSLVPRPSYYQWDEVMTFQDAEESQGLCPPGWHVPSESDWNQLFAFYQGNAFAGSPLLYSGYSGFNAHVTGISAFNRNWYLEGLGTLFWSSTSHGPWKAWAHGMNEYNYSVSYYPSYRGNGFSVRCVKD